MPNCPIPPPGRAQSLDILARWEGVSWVLHSPALLKFLPVMVTRLASANRYLIFPIFLNQNITIVYYMLDILLIAGDLRVRKIVKHPANRFFVCFVLF